MHCQWCGIYIGEVKSRQIYCSESCRTEATKVNTKQRQMREKVKRRKENPITCKRCGTVISVYRNGKFCYKCEEELALFAQIKQIKKLGNEKPPSD